MTLQGHLPLPPRFLLPSLEVEAIRVAAKGIPGYTLKMHLIRRDETKASEEAFLSTEEEIEITRKPKDTEIFCL